MSQTTPTAASPNFWPIDWALPAGVHAVCTTRVGGVSQPPFDGFNLGDHVRDDPQSVAANRALLQAQLGRARPVFLSQVHGVDVASLNEATRDGTVADACITQVPQVACTIMVADCLPVLLCDTAGRWVAAAHAGWRGLAGEQGVGVLETLLDTSPLSDTPPDRLLAWLGPCIGPQAFEVGPEVRAAFVDKDIAADVFFKPLSPGKWLADLAGLARLRLHRLGVQAVFGNDSEPAWCTFSQNSRFFSHRRDSRVLGQSGRMAACIWLAD